MANGFVLPSRAQVNSYQRGGVNAARIGVANAKLDSKNANKTPQSILDYQALLASMPSYANMGANYDKAFSGLGTELGNLHTAQGATDVAGLVGAIGAGIGANANVTSNAATGAGTISNNDSALLASMAADFGRAKNTDMKDMLSQRMNVTSSLAGAEDTFNQNKTAASDRLAQARQAYATSRPDPLVSANNWLSLMTNAANYNKVNGGPSGTSGTSGKSGKSGKSTTTGTVVDPNIAAAKVLGMTVSDYKKMLKNKANSQR